MENNLFTQGFVLLDVDVAALNNAGKDNTTDNDNNVKTKSLYKNGRKYVYVSGQAWRYWWRNTLQKQYNWILSPIKFGEKKKVVFTSVDPILYPDDDIFGYMRAATEKEDESDNDKSKKKGKKKDVSVTRVSPLKNSALVSVASVSPVANFSSMSRQDGNPAPFSREEYSAVLKGMFSIDLNAVGTFSDYNRSGYKNISDEVRQEAQEKHLETIDDPFGTGTLLRLPLETRIKRATESVLALKNISGGALQTTNLADVTPKFIVLATTKTGNHPFSHIAKADDMYGYSAMLNVKGIKEVIEDYKSTFKGKIFIGKRSGFFDEYEEGLKKLSEGNENIEYLSVNKAIDSYVEQLKTQIG